MRALEGLFDWGLGTAWQVALLVVAVLVTQRLCGRWLSPRGRYALWLLVVIRLALPVLPELPIGLVAWSEGAQAETAPEGGFTEVVLRARTPEATSRPEEASRSVEPVSAEEAPASAVDEPRAELAPASSPSVPRASKLPGRESPMWAAPAEPEPAVGAVGKSVVALLWLLGTLVFLSRALLSELRFRARLREAEELRDAEVVELAERCRSELGLRRAIRLLRVDALPAPAVHGWLRPRVLIPSSTLARLDTDGLERVLRHELAHVRSHDVLLAGLLCGLRAMWWPHPLVHLAFSRLCAAQEALRDWEVVRSERSPAPLAYARTLLALATTERATTPPGAIAFLRRGHVTKQRIIMIADYRRPGFVAGVLATVLFAGLGLASLTSARAVPSEGADAPAGKAEELRKIVVERDRQVPAWRERIERQLEARVAFECTECRLTEVLEFLSQVGGLNLVVHPDALEECGELQLSAFTTKETSIASVLRAVCDMTGELDYCLLREAVYIGRRYDMPAALELRFYKIAPLLELAPPARRAGAADEIMQLAQELTSLSSDWGEWEAEGVSIEAWDDILVVHQTEAMHERVQALLDRLLNRGAQPERVPADWERILTAMLAEPASLDYDSLPFKEALAYLSVQHGLRLMLEAEDDPDPVTLRLGNVSLATAIDWLASLGGLYIEARPEGVVFTDNPPKELRFYEVGDLFGPTWAPHDEALRDSLDSAIRYTIDGESWDADPRCQLTYWADLMLVVQSAPVHERIGATVDALRRAKAR